MKYILLENDTIEIDGRKLFRIQAVKNFSNVKVGDLGGYIEKEANLSHYGNAWVYGNAKVYGDAEVYGYAKVYGNAKVCGYAEVCDDAKVYGYAEVCGYAKVYGYAEVYGYAKVYGNAKVCGYAEVCDDAKVYGYAEVCGYAKVYGNAKVYGISDYIVFKNFWSSGRYFTYTKSNKKWAVGCFYGTGEELIEKAYKDNEKSGKFYEKYVNFVKELEEIE